MSVCACAQREAIPDPTRPRRSFAPATSTDAATLPVLSVALRGSLGELSPLTTDWVNGRSTSSRQAARTRPIPISLNHAPLRTFPKPRPERRHPLLIPRSLVRSQHGPSDDDDPRGTETYSGQRPRGLERSRRPASHEESQGHHPYRTRERVLFPPSNGTRVRRMLSGQHEVNTYSTCGSGFRAHRPPRRAGRRALIDGQPRATSTPGRSRDARRGMARAPSLVCSGYPLPCLQQLSGS